MSLLLRCPKGHTWTDATGPDETTVQVTDGCPVCGAKAVDQSQWSASQAATQEMTLGDDGPASQPGIGTIQLPDGPHASDQTAPTVPAGVFDDRTLAESDSAAAQSLGGPSTLPLDSSKVEDSDRTTSLEDEGEASDQTQSEDGVSEGDKTQDQTQATALGRATDAGAKQAQQTGKHRPVAAPTKATARKGKAKLPSKVAGYDILGELGRGGMGVVYKARQAGLNRLCALKMILGGGMASSDAIARFKIEAEAIAHLQHPNIVQVYEIGETDGCPYFSLEFVEGTNLQSKIAGSPQPAKETARMMQQICEGVDAAHKKGVLHRDLKPANVLLTKDNIPKITDFGLAKRISEQDHGQTRTGAILGTPSYMAPEQAMGKAKEVGPAADVYSLGAVLYDMLTGRPPFRGETIMDTLNQVQKLEPVAPVSLAPKVPLDMQTICLKALQKDPKKRYASAGEMAEDLRRYQANEPIKARPTPLWEKGVMWAKRRPAIATLIGVSTLAFVCLLTLGGLWLESERQTAIAEQKRQKEKADSEEAARLTAEENARREKELHEVADANFKQARDAVATLLSQVAAISLQYQPGMEVVRKELLEKALGYYQKFLEQRQSDPNIRVDVAKAHEETGKIYRMMGQNDDAAASYQKALDRYHEVAKDTKNKTDVRGGVAKCNMELALVRQLQGRWAESEKDYATAFAAFKDLTKEDPSNKEWLEDLASVHYSLGNLCQTQARYKEADDHYNAAIKTREDLMAKGVKTMGMRQALGGVQLNRGILLIRMGLPGEGQKTLESARDIFAALSKAAPKVPDYRTDWAYSLHNLGICLSSGGKAQPAAASLNEAIGLLEKLQKDFPKTPIYRQRLASAIAELGLLQGLQGQLQPAADRFDQAIALLDPAFKEQPDLAAVRLQLAQTHTTMGIVQIELKNAEKAKEHYKIAIGLLDETNPTASSAPEVCAELATANENLAELLTAFKQPVEADKSWERVLSLRQQLVYAFPKSSSFAANLAMTHALFAGRLQKAGKTDEAEMHAKASIAALRKAIDLGFNDVNLLNTAPEYQVLRQRAEFKQLVNELQAKVGGGAKKE